ncbi:Basic helix-loop-helix transcription factor [Trema orientale]|uniref:Basic helix-loop-helix transcription factor n=1 Tax=Trema orientale TaxID=63057 RepID=A0A2P5E923_TREOI|nr:Basic helix-loop-helix transcription factor [Trema orientale]
MGTESSLLQWENHSWPNNLSNSDNYSSGGAAATGGDEEEKSAGKKKMAASNSDGCGGGGRKGGAVAGKELGLVQQSTSNNKKRSRGGQGVGSKNGKKTSTASTTGDQLVKDGKGGGGSGSGSGGGESDHEIHIWTERERRKKMRNMFANLHALLPQLPPKADKSTIVDEAVNYIRTLQQTLHKLQKQKLEKLQGPTNIITPSSTFNVGETSINNINNPQPKLAYETREAFLADQGSCNDLVSMGNNCNNNNNNNPNSNNSLFPVIFQTWTSSNVVLNICGDEAHISVCSPKKPGLFSSICYVLEKHKITLISAQISSDASRNMYMIHAHYATSSRSGSDQFLEAFNSVEEVFKQAVGEMMFWVSS